MPHTYETHRLEWNSITIEVRYLTGYNAVLKWLKLTVSLTLSRFHLTADPVKG